ncbi:MAG: beta-lactamase family protein [Planctomycetes bacterium]|nr:beta-lactamase family protein [Planctomycetota bacterium]
MRTSPSLSPFAILSLAAVIAAQQPPAWRDAVRAAVEAKWQEDAIPGISVAIATGGGEREPEAFAFGFADVENDVPASGATVYRLASISKPIAAVCAMKLVEQGKLDLDRDVHEIVAAWPEKPWPVTTRQLLAHLGGVRHYKPGEGESTVHYPTQTAALVRFADDPLLHEPGTKYRYSTFGYNLVAAVVEAAAQKPFPQVVEEFVAAPSAASSMQDDDVRRLIRGRAQGYLRTGGELRNSVLMDGSYKLGGGGLCCSAVDLARFGQALCGGRLVTPQTLDAMWTRQRTKSGNEIGYGLGFTVGRHDGRRVIHHSGAQSRVSTMLYLLPDDGVAIVALCNLEGVKLGGFAQRLGELVTATERR